MRIILGRAALGLLAGALVISPAVVHAQSNGSASMGSLQTGYGGARYSTAQATSGSTRDANGNRLVVNGIIQSGASQYSSQQGGVSANSQAGTAGNTSSIGGATAIGNSLNVVVQGNRNTVIVNSTQTNTGNVTAGTVLNGTLVFP